jgi:hypothetical protein
MYSKTAIALAAVFVIGVSSNAMAQSIGLDADAPLAASQDVIASPSLLTPVALRSAPQSTQLRRRQSRNAGLRTDGYAPRDFPADNYQYWHQACCL